MEKEFLKKLAEDVLSEDGKPVFTDPAIPNERYWENQDEEKKAKRIYLFLKSRIPRLTEGEKNEMRAKIETSISSFRRKRMIGIGSAIAAVVILGLIISALVRYQSDLSELKRYAAETNFSNTMESTKLILGDKEVYITETNATIQYKGGNVVVNSTVNYRQKISSKNSSFNSLIVPYSKRTKLTLADGTQVWLNSGSRLIFPSVFNENQRDVYLEGEALFDVTHDEKCPFNVITKDIDVKVLGTKFGMSVYDDDEFASAVLVEGSIEMRYDKHKLLSSSKTKITPGIRATYDVGKNKFTQSHVSTDNYIGWANGFMVFKQTELKYILKKLSRHYNIEVEMQDRRIENETFSGKLDLSNTADQAFETIKRTSNFTMEKIDNKIILK